MMKKLGREVWDLVAPYVSSTANKRTKDQTSSPAKVRTDYLSKATRRRGTMMVVRLYEQSGWL